MKILIAGDYCPQNRVATVLAKREYKMVLGEVREITSSADYSIVNLECTITKGGEKPITKIGPNLQCDETAVEALQWAGFNCVTLANNHFRDFGNEGVCNTLAVLHQRGFDFVGGGVAQKEAAQILYKKIGGKTIAVINCCEHEFTLASGNKAGSNPLNPVRQFYDICEARKHADHVLVIVHGGHEHYQLPSVRMQGNYRFFVDAGADAVVNHHQHCYSGYEVYHGRPIFYGLGNFCFDDQYFFHKEKNWSLGYMVELTFGQEIDFKIYPYRQCASEPSVNLLEQTALDEELQRLNKIINDCDELRHYQDIYYNEQMKYVLSGFQPFRHRWAFAARRFKLLPSFMSRRWQTALYNMLLCESHRDKVEFFLENYNKGPK